MTLIETIRSIFQNVKLETDKKQDILTQANAGTNVSITEENGVKKINAAGGSGSADLTNYYTKSEVDSALNSKQSKLTFDSSPTTGSSNAVTSGGVADALTSVMNGLSNNITNGLGAKQNKLTSANAGTNITITEENGVVKINAESGEGGEIGVLDSTPTEDSTNLVTSGGVYDAISAAIGQALNTSY